MLAASGMQGRHVLRCSASSASCSWSTAIMIYDAASTFSGGVARALSQGPHYNERIAAAERQAELGWQTEIAEVAETGRSRLTLRRQSAQPVTGLEIEAVLGRPATNRQDRRVAIAETAPGVYAAQRPRSRAMGAGRCVARGAVEPAATVYRPRGGVWSPSTP